VPADQRETFIAICNYVFKSLSPFLFQKTPAKTHTQSVGT